MKAFFLTVPLVSLMLMAPPVRAISREQSTPQAPAKPAAAQPAAAKPAAPAVTALTGLLSSFGTGLDDDVAIMALSFTPHNA